MFNSFMIWYGLSTTWFALSVDPNQIQPHRIGSDHRRNATTPIQLCIDYKGRYRFVSVGINLYQTVST